MVIIQIFFEGLLDSLSSLQIFCVPPYYQSFLYFQILYILVIVIIFLTPQLIMNFKYLILLFNEIMSNYKTSST